MPARRTRFGLDSSCLIALLSDWHAQANVALEQTFSRTASIPGLGREGVWSAIDTLSRLGLGGGRVYDTAIAQCVVEAGATVLLTWNTKHFLAIVPAGLEVREP
jgi:predicted nucleic acid-binding protein